MFYLPTYLGLVWVVTRPALSWLGGWYEEHPLLVELVPVGQRREKISHDGGIQSLCATIIYMYRRENILNTKLKQMVFMREFVRDYTGLRMAIQIAIKNYGHGGNV